MRVLATKSALDAVVGKESVIVQRVMNLIVPPTEGLGAVGPTTGTVAGAGGSRISTSTSALLRPSRPISRTV
jgi:hypothetical protein